MTLLTIKTNDLSVIFKIASPCLSDRQATLLTEAASVGGGDACAAWIEGLSEAGSLKQLMLTGRGRSPESNWLLWHETDV